jgi:hypothetical protein
MVVFFGEIILLRKKQKNMNLLNQTPRRKRRESDPKRLKRCIFQSFTGGQLKKLNLQKRFYI